MARKKHKEEHENLERWLISYSDFITLLFATFVVLYALSQIDIGEFSKLESALREAFSSSPTVMEGKEGILSQQMAMLEGGANSPQINPIMLEFLSQKYEQSSMDDTKAEVDKLKKAGVKAEVNERGLVLRFDDKSLKFAPDSAEIDLNSKETLRKVGKLIDDKFKIHVIKVEGHTDSDKPGLGSRYPTNWELSTARSSAVVNFLINNNNISPNLMIAVGFADSSPLVPNDSPSNKAKNRRVEIVILKNKYGKMETKDLQEILRRKVEADSKRGETVLKTEQEPQDEEIINTRLDDEPVKKPVDETNLYLEETNRIRKKTPSSVTTSDRPYFTETR